MTGYDEQMLPAIVRFQEEAYPHRRREWIADRWQWMFEASARRLGVPPKVWVYRDADAVVGHHGAIPVRLKMNGAERVAPWLVESMVLQGYRDRAVGTRLLATSTEDEPLSLSLGQAPYMRDIQLKLGWEQVVPLDTFFYPLRPDAVARGKTTSRLRAGVLGASLGALTRFRHLRGRPRTTWSPEVRRVDRFGPAHDALWAEASQELSCAVVRDASYLNWKYVDQPGQRFERLEVRRGDDVVAVAVITIVAATPAYKYRRAFVVDLVLRPSDDERVWHTLSAVRDQAEAGGADALVMYLTSTALGPRLERFGFLRRDPTRVLLVEASGLSEPEARELRSGDNWYLTMGDSDVDRPWTLPRDDAPAIAS